MNAKISVFVICIEAIMYLLLYNLHDCTFNIHKKVSLNVECEHILSFERSFSVISVSPMISNVHKMVRHTLKIVQQFLHDFQRVFDNFVDTRHDRVKNDNLLGKSSFIRQNGESQIAGNKKIK